MAVVDQDVSAKPIIAETVLDALNREVVPVLRRVRAGVNKFVPAYAETVGDGLSTSFSVAHNLDSEDVFVELRNVATGELVVDKSLYTITVDDANTVIVNTPVAPAASNLRVLVRV